MTSLFRLAVLPAAAAAAAFFVQPAFAAERRPRRRPVPGRDAAPVPRRRGSVGPGRLDRGQQPPHPRPADRQCGPALHLRLRDRRAPARSRPRRSTRPRAPASPASRPPRASKSFVSSEAPHCRHLRFMPGWRFFLSSELNEPRDRKKPTGQSGKSHVARYVPAAAAIAEQERKRGVAAAPAAAKRMVYMGLATVVVASAYLRNPNAADHARRAR